jgi:hypothetical protein
MVGVGASWLRGIRLTQAVTRADIEVHKQDMLARLRAYYIHRHPAYVRP